MSVQQPLEHVLTKQQLLSPWTVWFTYSCEAQSELQYQSNLMKVQRLESWELFAHFWKQTQIKDINHYFINPENGEYRKYKFGKEERKIDSISFFKKDIEPRWEYGLNHKCGYFNFGIPKESKKLNQIYEATVFLALGADQDISLNQHINGIRVVDIASKKKHPNRARIEIWVDFRHDDSPQSLKRLEVYKKQLEEYYQSSIEETIVQMKFFNISCEPEKRKD